MHAAGIELALLEKYRLSCIGGWKWAHLIIPHPLDAFYQHLRSIFYIRVKSKSIIENIYIYL